MSTWKTLSSTHLLLAPSTYVYKHCLSKHLIMSLQLWAQPSNIKSKKVWVSQLNIHLQQQMGVFEVSIMETLQSLRDKIKSVKKHNSEVGVDQISPSANPKPGPSKQPDLQKSPSTSHTNTKPLDKPMETDFVGPHLPPQFVQWFKSEIPSDVNSEQSKHFAVAKPQKHSDKRKHKAVTSSSSSEKSEASVQVQGGFFCT